MNELNKEICELLICLDKEFDETTASLGAEGWVKYFAEDGIMVPSQGEVIRGKIDIRNTMEKSFSMQEYSLRWSPEESRVSEDCTMGYTYGRYIRQYRDSNGLLIESTGRYTSIWNKQQNGEWKIVLDIGN